MSGRSVFGRRIWNFPSFAPDKLREEHIRKVWVTVYRGPQWTVHIAINLPQSLRNEPLPIAWINKRMRIGLQRRTRTSWFHILGGSSVESTVTIRCAYRDGTLGHLRRGLPIVMEVARPSEGTEGQPTLVYLTEYDLIVNNPTEVKPAPRRSS
jgi:hypothetical protein